MEEEARTDEAQEGAGLVKASSAISSLQGQGALYGTYIKGFHQVEI